MDRHCWVLLQLFTFLIHFSFSNSQEEVRSAVVPIFQPRSTNEPITFTFTTPSPRKRVVTEFPVHVEAREKFPTLRPEPYNAQNAPWELSGPVGSISPIIEVPSIDLSMPIYNQAQYFRALQKASASNTVSREIVTIPIQPKIIPVPSVQSVPVQKIVPVPLPPKTTNVLTPSFNSETFWKDVESAWVKAKSRLTETGAMSDWRRLWEKLTGVLEPFLLEVGERFGKTMNRAMRQQAGVTWKKEFPQQ